MKTLLITLLFFIATQTHAQDFPPPKFIAGETEIQQHMVCSIYLFSLAMQTQSQEEKLSYYTSSSVHFSEAKKKLLADTWDNYDPDRKRSLMLYNERNKAFATFNTEIKEWHTFDREQQEKVGTELGGFCGSSYSRSFYSDYELERSEIGQLGFQGKITNEEVDKRIKALNKKYGINESEQ